MDAKLDKAMEFSEASPEPNAGRSWIPMSSPRPSSPPADVETDRQLRRASPPGTGQMRQISYAQALVEADARGDAARPERVFIMGEDVGLYGGAYGATRDLFKEFGEWRVLDTPISEATIGGAAVGAAMAGMRPIAEIMYVDFTPLAMDQIANQGAKNRYMFGGKTTRADGDPHRRRRRARHCRPPLAKPGIAVDALPRHLCGHALHSLRRQRACSKPPSATITR